MLCHNKAKKCVRAVGMPGNYASKTIAFKTNRSAPIAGTSPKDCPQPAHTNPSSGMLSSVEELQATFLESFDTTGSMFSEYHMMVDPIVVSVQYGCRRVPIELQGADRGSASKNNKYGNNHP